MNQARFLFLILVCIATAFASEGQQPARVSQSQSSSKAITVEDVIKLSKAGLGDDVIIDKIKQQPQPFNLSTDQLIQLKSASVSDRVIRAMVNPSAAPSPEPSAPLAGAKSPAPAGFPTDIGVYVKKNSEWVEVLPEVVNWKTGGVLKHIATAGVMKGDVNGHIPGTGSKNSVNSPLEFLIIVAEGVAITEYQLLRLHVTPDGREFRTVTGGVLHESGGATRDLVPFEGKKIAPRTFSVSLAPSMGAGEYGFLPPGALASTNGAGSQGKIYSFHMAE